MPHIMPQHRIYRFQLSGSGLLNHLAYTLLIQPQGDIFPAVDGASASPYSPPISASPNPKKETQKQDFPPLLRQPHKRVGQAFIFYGDFRPTKEAVGAP